MRRRLRLYGPRRSAQPQQREGGHGSRETLQAELADRLRLHQILDQGQHPAGHEDLPRPGLPAEPRGQVGDGAHRAVVPATLEPDGADGGVPVGHADAEVQRLAAGAQYAGDAQPYRVDEDEVAR